MSKTTTEVCSARIEARTAPKIEAYTTDAAIDPDWSIASTTSRWRLCCRRPLPTSRSGTIVWCPGR